VIIDVIGSAVFDFRPLRTGPLSDNASLGRGEPGSTIEAIPTTEVVVGASMDMNGTVGGDSEGDDGWGSICVSCNSTLSSGGSSSVVECVGRVCPRIVLGTAAGVWIGPASLRTGCLVFVRCLGRTGVLKVTRPGPEKKSSQF